MITTTDPTCPICGQSESLHKIVCPDAQQECAQEVERLKERITVLNFTVRSREDEIRRLVRELNTAHSKERK